MNEQDQSAERRRAAFKRVMAHHGLNVASWAKKADVSSSAIYEFLKGGTASLSVKLIEKLAAAINADAASLLADNESDSGLPTIPVVGVVRAGTWMSVDEIDSQILGRIPAIVPSYYADKAFALRVEGDSMDLVYEPGTLLICVKLLDYQREVRSKRKVIVYRRRGNDLIEATVKELIIDAKGKGWLWPRSSNPRHQEPIPVPDNSEMEAEDFSDGDWVEIHAIVIARWSSEEDTA